MVLESGTAKKENLYKFQNGLVYLFIKGLLDFTVLIPNIQWSCLPNIPGKSIFLYFDKST